MDLLKSFKRFYDIDQESYDLLISKFTAGRFKKGSFLVRPGQIEHNFYFVNKGIQMAYFDSGEKQHVINFTYPPYPSAVPESFMLQRPATYYLKCITESEFDYISYSSLQQLFEESQKIERLFRKMTENLLAGVLNRYIELHSLTIEQQFRIFTQRSPHLLQLIPHKYIASYLGIDPTNFSKLYNSVKI
jgi:CRP-like cAMP-binding protein